MVGICGQSNFTGGGARTLSSDTSGNHRSLQWPWGEVLPRGRTSISRQLSRQSFANYSPGCVWSPPLCRVPFASAQPPASPPIASVAEQLEAERFAREEPEPLIERFVLNTRSGTYHRRVDASASSAAACGWSFRSNPHAFVPDVRAGPKCKAQLCARCWPTLRAVASATGEVRLLAGHG